MVRSPRPRLPGLHPGPSVPRPALAGCSAAFYSRDTSPTCSLNRSGLQPSFPALPICFSPFRPWSASIALPTARPTTRAAALCPVVRRPCGRLSRPRATPRRSPGVSSIAFGAQPPDLRFASLMDLDFAMCRPLVRRLRLISSFCSSARTFDPRFLQTPASRRRFTNPSPPSGWVEDFHFRAIEHARHTTKPLSRRAWRGGVDRLLAERMWVLEPTPSDRSIEMADLSPLRRRMIEDMTVRNLSPATQRSYISAVSKLSRYFGRSPDRLELEDVRAFQVHLVSTGISWPALNQIVCALRFFYGVTLGEALIPERIPYARQPLKLPVVLSADEVVQFLEAVSSLKSRAALTTAYAAGLRASEVAGLRIEDIDSARGVLRGRHGKGG